MTQEHDLCPVAGEGSEPGGQGFEGLAVLNGCGGILPSLGLCCSSLAFPHSCRVAAYVTCNPAHHPLQPGPPGTTWFGRPGCDPGPLDHVIRVTFADEAGCQSTEPGPVLSDQVFGGRFHAGLHDLLGAILANRSQNR